MSCVEPESPKLSNCQRFKSKLIELIRRTKTNQVWSRLCRNLFHKNQWISSLAPLRFSLVFVCQDFAKTTEPVSNELGEEPGFIFLSVFSLYILVSRTKAPTVKYFYSNKSFFYIRAIKFTTAPYQLWDLVRGCIRLTLCIKQTSGEIPPLPTRLWIPGFDFAALLFH